MQLCRLYFLKVVLRTLCLLRWHRVNVVVDLDIRFSCACFPLFVEKRSADVYSLGLVNEVCPCNHGIVSKKN